MTKKTSILAIIIVVALAAVGALLYIKYMQQPGTTIQLPANPEEEVQRLTQTGGKEELQAAQTKLSQFADKETDAKKKVIYWKGAMDAASSTGNTDAALELAKKIESEEKSADSAGRVAQAYSQLGQHATAIEWYTTAIDRSEKTPLNQRSPYTEFVALKKAEESKE